MADSETTLDDLWHAAVNGRGTFFSAKNPVDLANGLAETINSLQSRVGAGAAAATSNLQPVAGDNFAFTAQYQTVAWTGDLEARTIDLGTGFVAYRSLWSASALLDQRTAADRTIYTYDQADTTAPTTGNGNRLKTFCWPGAYASTLYPNCGLGIGEAELSATDMGNFNPLTLPQAVTWPTDGSGRDVSASAQNLVDYLRGDTSNEDQGGSASTDLYRKRTAPAGRHRRRPAGLREGGPVRLRFRLVRRHRPALSGLQENDRRDERHAQGNGFRGVERRHAARVRDRSRRRSLLPDRGHRYDGHLR